MYALLGQTHLWITLFICMVTVSSLHFVAYLHLASCVCLCPACELTSVFPSFVATEDLALYKTEGSHLVLVAKLLTYNSGANATICPVCSHCL